MMTKIHYQDDQEALVKAAGIMVHVFEPGETASLIKRASSSSIPDDIIERFRPDAGHFLTHLIAMGSTEHYGWNRNADGYKESTLKRDHPTFVSHGHYFEEHRNRDPKLARGTIKYSFYNPDQHRAELLIWGDIKKAAEDYEAARAGKPLSYSMSCRINHDVCNCCEHKAATIANHCDHIKYSANQYLDEFQKYAYVDNPNCKFFDISKVANPADRIAHYLSYRFPDTDTEAKAACAGGVILGSDWAEYEGVDLPLTENDEPLAWSPAHQDIFAKLAAEVAYVNRLDAEAMRSKDPKVAFVAATGPNLFGEVSDDDVRTLRRLKPGTVMREFGKRAALMPFPAFYAYLTGKNVEALADDADYKAACCCMSDAIESMGRPDGNLCGNLHHEFAPSSQWAADGDAANDDAVQRFMDKATERFGLEAEPSSGRIIQITIKTSHSFAPTDPAKSASAAVTPNDKFYGQAYAQYIVQTCMNAGSLGRDVKEASLLSVASYIHQLAQI
jgi:hypothetical protein